MKQYDKYFTKVLITEKEISDKIVELAKWVDNTYKDSENLILVGLLKGSIPFMAKMMNHIEVDHQIDFMTLSSFKGGMEASGNIKLVMDLKQDIFDKDVLLVEDIVDSGRTLTKVINLLKVRNPKSIKIITLLDKPQGRLVEFVPDAFGFEVPNEFLAGFGLDVKEKLRNVPYVGIFDKKLIDEL
ncbi:MAG: hypoxanthine phosphoribosyltransferase [Mycoplasmataceae bacterium]|nr:hypoxanthine phosphoribosyltransferase [Mycoplasmataceae bacterium]